jgi:hypothetical protein
VEEAHEALKKLEAIEKEMRPVSRGLERAANQSGASETASTSQEVEQALEHVNSAEEAFFYEKLVKDLTEVSSCLCALRCMRIYALTAKSVCLTLYLCVGSVCAHRCSNMPTGQCTTGTSTTHTKRTRLWYRRPRNLRKLSQAVPEAVN